LVGGFWSIQKVRAFRELEGKGFFFSNGSIFKQYKGFFKFGLPKGRGGKGYKVWINPFGEFHRILEGKFGRIEVGDYWVY